MEVVEVDLAARIGMASAPPPAAYVSSFLSKPANDFEDVEEEEDRYDGDDDDEEEEEDDEEDDEDPFSSSSHSFRAVQTSPLLRLDTESFALVLGFLSPSEALKVASAPICKDWHDGYAFQPELWRTLCYQEPFGARTKPQKVAAAGASHEDDDTSSVDSEDSEDDSDLDDDDESLDMEHEIKRTFGRHRLLFSRFVRCQRYLNRIQEDAKMGRPPSVIEYAATSKSDAPHKKTPADLHRFLSRARHTHLNHHNHNPSAAARAPPPSSSSMTPPSSTEPISLADDGKARHTPKREGPLLAADGPSTKKARFGASALTQRLMLGAAGPTVASAPPLSAAPPASSTAALPWSCAIYSIANWMVAYPRAVGIQSLCLNALPCLMEDERHRLVAQRAGLADLVLMAMTRFPTVSKLQTSALHAIVLLARPIGGREGQLFSLSMAAQHNRHPNASSPPWNTTTDNTSSNTTGDNNGSGHGIQIVLDSMRRFPHDETLQAMGCWSLVNLALPPDQKDLLLRNGGINVILNSMTHHPTSVEVQFRALFSLINLVIPAAPSVTAAVDPFRGGPAPNSSTSTATTTVPLPPSAVDQTVGQVAAAMKHFCSNATILNRACLVLHNLSLTPDHHPSLLLDADCYHLLEWCVASYPTDAVLQQSASAALQRLQATLSKHESLRRRFQAKHVERKTALEAELLLPEDELWISDSDGGADASDSDDDVP